MSSLIISRIILGAFLAVSLSACSKDSKGSKATVRNKGGQQTGAQKPGTPTLDAEAAKAAADKADETKPADSTKPTNNDVISDDSVPTEAPQVSGSSITVKPMAPVLKNSQSAAPSNVKSTVAPVEQKSAAEVKPSVPEVTKPATTPPAKSAVVVTAAKEAQPVVKPEAKKPVAAPTKAAVAPAKQTAIPGKAVVAPASVQKDASKVAATKVEAKPEVKTEAQTAAAAKLEAQPAVKSEEKKPAVVAKDTKSIVKPEAKAATKTATPKKSAPSKSSPVSSTSAAKAAKAVEAKRLADEKSKADADRDAARATFVVKTSEDLDKDDTSKENLGNAGYKALVDQLLSKIDMKSASVASLVADQSYLSFESPSPSIVPSMIYNNLISSRACDAETTSGCLLIEVSKKNTVVLSYVGTQTKLNEKTKINERYFYRKNVENVDATTQANIEKLSRIAGGKTVVFTSLKTEAANEPASLVTQSSGPLTADNK